MSNITAEQKMTQQKEELERELNTIVDSQDLPPANIMVAGITGTGKSTLINAVFGSQMAATGSGKPVTEQINEYKNEDIPIRIWDTVGLELDNAKTEMSIRNIKKTIADKSSSKDKYDRVHAIWYCINSGSSRYQGAELNFIKELHDIGIPFIIVLTQCTGAEEEVNALEDEIKRINASMGMNDIQIVQVLAMPVKFRGMSDPIPAFGLEDLVNVTLECLPSFIKSGFIAAQKVSQNEKRRECEEIIEKYVEAAQNGFWDKVPLINIITTDNKIMAMFKKIAKMYNTEIEAEAITKILNECGVDSKNNFEGLVNPFYKGYSRKITNLLERKKKEGFSASFVNEDNNRSARMIAFYGYTFVDSIEELWKIFTEDQLKQVDIVVTQLVSIINRKLKERQTRR